MIWIYFYTIMIVFWCMVLGVSMFVRLSGTEEIAALINWGTSKLIFTPKTLYLE
jgi:hypothetical protein